VVRVPTVASASRFRRLQLRDAAIMRLLDCRCGNEQHHSYRAIAKQFGISPRSVGRVGKRSPLLPP
jgi:hypothetical protein